MIYPVFPSATRPRSDDVMNKQETDVELTDSMPRAARVQRCRVVAAP